MNGTENDLIIAIIAFISGSLFGALIYRLLKGDGGKGQRVEQQMDALQEKHTHYQAQVNDHFLKTAHLIKRLNEDYRDINAHLAQSASELCSEEQTNEIKTLNQSNTTNGDLEANVIEESTPETSQSPDSDIADEGETAQKDVEAPRDYAPKADSDKGTLTEGFGLKEKSDKEQASS